jgi:hypothetical protein
MEDIYEPRGGHRSDLGRIRSQNPSPIGCAVGKWPSISVRSVHRLDRVAVYSDDGLVGSVLRFQEKIKENKKAEKHTHESSRIIKKLKKKIVREESCENTSCQKC